MKIKRELRRRALTALVVGGLSSIATAETITQIVTTGYPLWQSGNTWSNGVAPADSVDSVVLNSKISTKNDYILGVGQTITQTDGGTWFYDRDTFDIFGSVDLDRKLQGTGGEGLAKNLILEVGSAFSLGAGPFDVASADWTTTWIADAAGVTDLQSSNAVLSGSSAVIDLSDYDLDGSGSTVVIMTTDEGATTFGSVTLIAPSNLAYTADVDYAYNGNTQIALTNIAVYPGPEEAYFLDPDPSAIEMEFLTTSTIVIGSLDLVYASRTNVNLSVTISDETNPNSFSVLSATNQLLDPSALETSIPLEFQFDNGVAALEGGQTAPGLVTIAWSDVGSSASGSFLVPISAVASDPLVFVDVDFGDLLDGTEVVNVDGQDVTLGMVWSGTTPEDQGNGFYKVLDADQTFTFTSDTAINFRIGFADMNNGAYEWFTITDYTGTVDDRALPATHSWDVDTGILSSPNTDRGAAYLTVLGTTGFTVQADPNKNWPTHIGGPDMGLAAYEVQEASNGTPYTWLDGYDLVAGGDYDAAELEDPDLDGLLNWEEYRCGTIPTNAASVLELNSISGVAAGEYAVAWQGVDGKMYNVLSTPSLVSSSWTTNAFDVPGVAPETVVTQTVPTTAAFFVIELAE